MERRSVANALVQASIRRRDATFAALLSSRRRIKRTQAILVWCRQHLDAASRTRPRSGSDRAVETISI